MKSGEFRSVCIGLGFSVMILIGLQANAATYNFSQVGFSGGGLITGTFDAIDGDGDGQISSFSGEVTNFYLSFMGDSIVGNFTHTLTDLSGLVYDLNSGFIGDGTDGLEEGLASNWDSTVGYGYESGLGPMNQFGGAVLNITTGASSSTSELIAVSSVPIPAAFWLLGSGLLGLAGFRRKIR